MHYSFSCLKRFERCPRSFRLQYVDKVQPDFVESVEAYMGRCVHETLEHLHKTHMSGGSASFEDVLAHYSEVWSGNITADIAVMREGMTQEHYRAMGEKCVGSYYRRHMPLPRERTVATELRINVDLFGDGRYILLGFVDRLDYADGVHEIHDYKTSRSLPTQDAVDGDRQLPLYELGLRQKFPDVRDVELVWHYLLHDAELRSKRTHEDLERLKEDLFSVIVRIDEALLADHFPAYRGGLCKYCEYRSHCEEGTQNTIQTRL